LLAGVKYDMLTTINGQCVTSGFDAWEAHQHQKNRTNYAIMLRDTTGIRFFAERQPPALGKEGFAESQIKNTR
jgi:hypothetical protein